jgi:ketosteroid isomerase-like protein
VVSSRGIFKQRRNIISTATAKVTFSQDEVDIRALIEAAHQVHHDKDAAAIVARYAPGAPIFNLAPPLVHHGVDHQEKQAWLDSCEGPIDLESRDFHITLSGDFAFAHGFYRMSGTPKAAGRPISFWMRETLGQQREAGVWKIVHEHASMPFYMDDGLRPAFDLQP